MPKYGFMDAGTCLPVLEALTHVFDIENALEFGGGMWSTYCLTRNCKNVTTVEDVKGWAIKIEREHSHRNNLKVVHWEKPMNAYLKETDKNFDLIFIDGKDRIECLRDSIDRSPIIVCHDTHQHKFKDDNLQWKDVVPVSHYKQLTYTGCLPYLTTIFYSGDLNINNILCDIKNYKYTGTYVDKNFWSEDDVLKMHRNGEFSK